MEFSKGSQILNFSNSTWKFDSFGGFQESNHAESDEMLQQTFNF
jgi:hypothetical protein